MRYYTALTIAGSDSWGWYSGRYQDDIGSRSVCGFGHNSHYRAKHKGRLWHTKSGAGDSKGANRGGNGRHSSRRHQDWHGK